MRDFFIALGILVLRVLVGVGLVLKFLAAGLIWSGRQALNRFGTKRAERAQRKVATQVVTTARLNVQSAGETGESRAIDADMAVRGPETVFLNDFEAADRIVSMKLDPPVGSIHLRVYHKSKQVKRELIISEPRLRSLLGARRIDLGDVSYEPSSGLEDIKEATVAKAEDLINQKGNERVKAIKPPKADFARAAEQPRKPIANGPSAQQPVAPVAAPQVPKEPEPEAHKQPSGKVAVPVVKTGVTYQGQLMAAGPKRQTPANRPAYEVFECTLRLDNGAELALRGAELERALVKAGCELGNRVAITQMGKIAVELGDGTEGRKNLYAVANLSSPKRG